MKHQKSNLNPRFKKSQSVLGIIFAFVGLFFIAMRYGNLDYKTGHDA